MDSDRIERAALLGRECAEESIRAGGADPRSADGDSLLPREPIGGDWEYVADRLGDLSDEEEAAFVSAYRAVVAEVQS